MDEHDLFTRELRSARERIAELQQRSDTDAPPGQRLLPEALAELDVAIEELSVTGQELQAQTVELSATRRALEAERERYQQLFEAAPVAYLVTDPTARIQEANRAAAALLGVPQRFLTGKPLAAYVDSGDRWAFRTMVTRLQRGDDDRVADRPVRFRRRGGQIVPAAVTVEPLADRRGGVGGLRWLLREAGHASRPRPAQPVELALAQDEARRVHLEALAELDPASDLDGTVQLVLDAGMGLLEVDGVGLMLADGQGRVSAAGGSDETSLALLRAQEHLMKGPCVHAFLLERVVRSGQLADDARWPQLAEAATVNGVAAVLAAPIGLYGGPVGACLLIAAAPKAWTDGDVRAAEAYASVLAALLEVAAEAQRSVTLASRLQETLGDHAVVEQAKGALMARKAIDAAAAAAELRRLARVSGRPLAEVARSLLRRLGAGPPP
jgi:PAS domain S-box-containing protein